jgi:hypothetical protein
MPTYPVKNKETSERKELYMTMIEYEEWRENNKEWDKDWSAGVAGVGEIGEWKDKLIKKHPSWNTILDKAGKMPNSNVKRIS